MFLRNLTLQKQLMTKRTRIENMWPIARVIETVPSGDTLIRKANILTGDGRNFYRPVNEIVLLIPVEVSNNFLVI